MRRLERTRRCGIFNASQVFDKVFTRITPQSKTSKLGSTDFHRLAGTPCWVLILTLISHSAAAAGFDWDDHDHFRSAKLHSAPAGQSGFSHLAVEQTGVRFTNRLSDALALNNQILENGAGVALGDIDRDEFIDIYLCGSENSNKLFRNLGNWRFSDVTTQAGVDCEGQFSTGAAFADLDGDGDLDLLVNSFGNGTRLFLNNGTGQFSEAPATGLDRTCAATSLAVADIDGDGDLDLYVATYRTSSARHEPVPPKLTAKMVNGTLRVDPADRFTGFLRADGTIEVVEKGEPDFLYLNDGRGHFRKVSWTGGAFLDANGIALKSAPEEWGLSVMMRDFNGDGSPDIYVCNDFFYSRDQLWFGDGKGRFQAAPPLAWRNMPLSSMAVDVADINRDGDDDFLTVEMLSRSHATRHRQQANANRPELGLPIGDLNYQPEELRNTLHLARGDGTFAEIGRFSGIDMTDWSWSAAFIDVDLDGWEDLLVCTGNNHDVLDMDAQNALDRAPPGSARSSLQFYPKLEQPNLAFRNRRDLTFEDYSEKWGFNENGISQAMAFGDLDNDGDLDVVVNNLNRAASLYRNNSSAPRIAVRLSGSSPNTKGIGAQIRVLGKPVNQTQEIISGGRYLACDAAMRTFAMTGADRVRIEVNWRSGKQTMVTSAEAGYLIELIEPK